MAKLIIRQGHQAHTLEFTPPQSLAALLNQVSASPLQPCGGRGVCGKCAVTLSGCVSAPNPAEDRCGCRLACQAVVLGDAEATLPTVLPIGQIEGGRATDLLPTAPMAGKYGAAVDIGTTTIALQLYHLESGQCLSAASMLNPQTSVAADVISRINASLKGWAADLQNQAKTALRTLLATACAQANVRPAEVTSMTVTGNTTMLYLLTGRNPYSLSRAPFHADHLFDEETRLMDRSVYLPPCLHAFVGADTACALLASGLLEHDETALLCDIGTNGELALWHQGKLYIASTAAGPAFEGAGISCGCASVIGAIDRVDLVSGRLHCRTIGEGRAVGICGSGLLDAIAALLDLEFLDETGYLEDDPCPLRDGITLVQSDIRSVQLAKAATYAGIMSLLSAAGCTANDVSTLYLAGGFGSHLNIRSALRIGLIPEALADKVQVVGNAALDGAAMLLVDTAARDRLRALHSLVQHVRLDGNPEFADLYIDSMMFE